MLGLSMYNRNYIILIQYIFVFFFFSILKKNIG